MTNYRISPSSLSFDWESCKRCFHLTQTNKWKKPWLGGFPSIFRKIDSTMREFYHQQDLADLFPDLPNGIIDTGEVKLTSAPIAIPNRDSTVTFTGELDALVRFDDGTVGVIDFKTSEVKPQYIDLYFRQLMAYAEILENPAYGNAEVVSQIGLIVVTPSRFTQSTYAVIGGNKSATLSMKVTWVEFPKDLVKWRSFLIDLVDLLDGEEPIGKDGCAYCAMQRASLAEEVTR
jgi:hypothetical protein